MTLYLVDVTSFPSDKAKVVRALRTIGRLPLKKANDMYVHIQNHKTTTLLAGVHKDVAESVAASLKEAEMISSISVCDVASPVLLDPNSAHIFVWEKPAKLVKQYTHE
ncbi:MAG TPA: ribosomal protein L7/L12 [Rhodanobacteraceae bacterium]|jgi:hypothetical protein|nr:ribosomal protein L7/L12 [Rhodanobacteraceae bacterium]